MRAFPVWVHSNGIVCQVRVEGFKNVHWLLERLSRVFIFKTSEAVHEGWGSSSFTFSVIHSFQMTQPKFERLLRAIPEVRLTRIAAKRRT